MTYRSHADLGGKDGLGRVAWEAEAQAFHAAWEPQAMALMLATSSTGAWNVDMARSVLEALPNYSQLSYYGKWIAGLQELIVMCGLVAPDEIAAARMLHPARPVAQILRAADVEAVIAAGSPTQRPETAPAQFSVGEWVCARDTPIDHHTRLPGYARSKIGRIERVHGVHVFPDTNAQGLGEQPQWLYAVVFAGRELWGESSSHMHSVSIDAWEPYLEYPG